MAEGFIRLPPDDLGKRIRTLTQSVAGVDVEQEVHTLAGPDGTLLDPATLAKDASFAALEAALALLGTEATLDSIVAALQGLLTVQIRQGASLLSLTNRLPVDPHDGTGLDLTVATGTVTPGSPLTVTPSSAMRLRVWYVSADPSPDAVAIGRVTGTLDGKGEIYRQYGIAHRQRFDGAVNVGGGEGALVVAVTAGTVEVTVHYEEVP